MIGSLQGVLFDFDYTLADSSRGVIACANGALGEMGFAAASSEAVRRTIGLTLGDAFTVLTGAEDAGRRGDMFGAVRLKCWHAVEFCGNGGCSHDQRLLPGLPAFYRHPAPDAGKLRGYG